VAEEVLQDEHLGQGRFHDHGLFAAASLVCSDVVAKITDEDEDLKRTCETAPRPEWDSMRRTKLAIICALVVGLSMMGTIVVSGQAQAQSTQGNPQPSCITGPGPQAHPSPPSASPDTECINLYYQNAYTTTDTQYSHDSNADIEAYSSAGWGMTMTIWGDFDGNKLEYSTSYTHTYSFSYGAKGETTFVQEYFKYQLWQDYYSGSYHITAYSDLASYYVANKGSWDWKTMPGSAGPGTQFVSIDPGVPPVNVGFTAQSSSTMMLQLQVGVNVFGEELNVGISWSGQSGSGNQVSITLTNPDSVTRTYVIYWEFYSDVNGVIYGFAAHVWKYS